MNRASDTVGQSSLKSGCETFPHKVKQMTLDKGTKDQHLKALLEQMQL